MIEEEKTNTIMKWLVIGFIFFAFFSYVFIISNIIETNKKQTEYYINQAAFFNELYKNYYAGKFRCAFNASNFSTPAENINIK